MKKTLRSLGLVVAFSLCGTAAFAGVTKKPYMIYDGLNTTMTVLWQDNAVETTNTISWGTDTTYSLGSATVPEYGPSNQHKYQITGLQPATKYYYKVEDTTNGVYGTGSFITAPASDAKAVKFLAFGDTRSTPLAMEGVIQEMRKVYAADQSFQSLNIQAGDWVASDGESNWTNEWFNANPQTRLMLAEQPVMGVKGNHEDASGYSKYYPKYYPYAYLYSQPKAGDPLSLNNLYYSFDYGPVHFTVVDQYSTYTAGSPQYNWVVNDLATTTKPWKILVYHEPAWTAGTHGNNPTTQAVFDPLIKQYGVDLVYAGHNHNYARCQANDTAEANGDSIALKVPYITNGGGGAGLYAVDTTNTGAYKHVAKAIMEYEYMTFDINDRTLTANVYTVTQPGGVRLNGSALNTNTVSNLFETITLVHSRPNNIAPTVALTSPVAGAPFDALATVAIAADASDDVSVAKVEFFNGATKLGQATAAPFQFTWSGVQSGTYTLTAKATDNENASTTSAPVTITVTNVDNIAPSVSLTSPANGVSIFAGGSVSIAATAADTDGSVTKVEFYAGVTKLGESVTAPFLFTWTSVPAGNHAITAVATDNDGGKTTSASVNVSAVTVPAGGFINFFENFNSMGTTGTTPPAGWSMKNANSGSNSTWSTSISASGTTSVATMVNAPTPLTAITTPNATKNNGYNAAAAGVTSDRMLATSPTSIAGAAIQLQLTNGSSGYVDRLKIGYDIYRINAPTSLNELQGFWLFYSLDNGTSWTNVSALNPTVGGPGGVIVPNTIGVTTVPPTLVTLAGRLNPGASILLRWVDDNGVPTSPDQMYGLDNVSITTPVPLQVDMATSGLVFNRATRLYNGTMTVTNTSQATISGQVSVWLNSLTSGVTLANASGTLNGTPYINQTLPQALTPGASITIPLSFSNPANAKINFTPVTFQE
jgi:predicted phosphodiesterase